MYPREFAAWSEEKLNSLTKKINIIGVVSLFGMMMITTIDVLSRFLFNRPVLGSIEITGIFLLFTILLGLPYATAQNKHVRIEMVMELLPRHLQAHIDIITRIIALAIFCLTAWQTFRYALFMHGNGAETTILQLPLLPFILVTVLSFALLAVVLGSNVLNLGALWIKNYKTLLILGCVTAAMLLFLYWIGFSARNLPVRLSPLVCGVLGMATLFLLLLAGLPVFYSLLLIGFLGMAYLRGSAASLSLLGSSFYTMGNEYHFSVIPLFILMGEFCFYSRIGQDLYTMTYRWMGHLPGGIAMGTVCGCGGFAAVCGDSLATAVTMGTVAIPEMRKYQYHPGLAAGCVAAGGTLGVLIPPSLAFILYALLTDQSIATLFIAGIIPGILLTGMFMLGIYLMVRRNPVLGPPGPKFSLPEKMAALKGVWAILLLVVVVIGGMYGGVFTPTEGGGIGAFGAMIIGIIRGRLNWLSIWSSLLEAGKISAVCIGIMMGANLFGYFMAASRLPMELANYIAGLTIPPLMILSAILLIYILLGTIVPAIPMLILTVPIFYPVVTTIGYNPIWYGVIMVLMFELAVITPPMGINVLALRTVSEDISVSTMFKGVLPFVLIMIACVALMIVFPDLALFLPGIFGNN